MLYRQRFDTFIRIYDEAGYIANFNDHVTDKSGAVFLKVLSRKPRELKELAEEVKEAYKNADPIAVEQDRNGFFKLLEEDGFIISGETTEEFDRKDIRFSYSELMPKTVSKDFSPDVFRTDKDNQNYLENHFKNNPPNYPISDRACQP